MHVANSITLLRAASLSDIQMMNILIIFIHMLPPQVEMHKVFEPYFGINFDSFKVRIIGRFASNRTIHTRGHQ